MQEEFPSSTEVPEHGFKNILCTQQKDFPKWEGDLGNQGKRKLPEGEKIGYTEVDGSTLIVLEMDTMSEKLNKYFLL